MRESVSLKLSGRTSNRLDDRSMLPGPEPNLRKNSSSSATPRDASENAPAPAPTKEPPLSCRAAGGGRGREKGKNVWGGRSRAGPQLRTTDEALLHIAAAATATATAPDTHELPFRMSGAMTGSVRAESIDAMSGAPAEMEKHLAAKCVPHALASSPTSSTAFEASAFALSGRAREPTCRALGERPGVCAGACSGPEIAAPREADKGASGCLHRLEGDLVQLCLMHLPVPALARCAAVSKALQLSCASEVVWEHVCCRGGYFLVPPSTPPPGGWRSLYQRLRALAVTPWKWSFLCWRELDQELAQLEEDAVLVAARQSGYECFAAEVCLESASPEEAQRRDASANDLYMTQPVSFELVKGDAFSVHVELMDEAGSDRLSLWIVRGAAECYYRQGGLYAGLAAWPLSLPPPPTYIHAPRQRHEEAAGVTPSESEEDGSWFHVFQLRHLVMCGGEIVESDGGHENSSFELGHIPSRILKLLPVGAPEGYSDDSWEIGDDEDRDVRSCGDGLGLAMDDEALSLLERHGAAAPAGRRFRVMVLVRSLFSHVSDADTRGMQVRHPPFV